MFQRFLIGFFLVATQFANAQNFEIDKEKIEAANKNKNFYLKTNPVAMLQGPLALIAEYRLALEAVQSERLSYQVSGAYLNKSLFFNPIQAGGSLNPKDFTWPGYRLQGEIRFYYLKFEGVKNDHTKYNPSGFYLAANVSYLNATLRLKNQAYPRNIFTNYSVNALFGLQAMVKQAAGLDLFLGLGYKENTVTNIDYRLQRSKVNLIASGYSPYYASNLKLTLGMNFTFGLF